MSESLLCADISSWLQTHARGSANAKPRRVLLDHLRALGHSTTDRSLRRTYADMPEVGTGQTGLFLIVTPADRKLAEHQLEGRAKSEFYRASEIRKAAPQGQIPLFGEEAR